MLSTCPFCHHAGPERWLLPLAISLLTFLVKEPVFAQAPPLTGTAVPQYAPLDRAVLEFMDRIGCQAAAVAVSRQGKLLFSRGYGWSDAHKRKPTAPDVLMRIAGITQPITAAAVKKLIRDGKLSFDTKAFPFLKLKPPRGSTPDPRLDQITVGELLENKGGWDAQSGFEPFAHVQEIQKSLRLTRRPRPADIVRYMLGEQLQFDPGQRTAASNFGYCVLGRLIEKASKKSYGNYIVDDIIRPLGVDEVRLARSFPGQREVWYPVKDAVVEITDSYGGLVASAPALCKFLDAYWANGNPRRAGQEHQWAFVGNFEGTTAFIRQRLDGCNIAVLFNGRRQSSEDEDNRELERLINEAMDKVAAATLRSEP
jgi:CubicO group peptidase (beta-lactamase class C family)